MSALHDHLRAKLSDGEALATKARELADGAIFALDQANRIMPLGEGAEDLRLDLIGTRATLDRAATEFARLRMPPEMCRP